MYLCGTRAQFTKEGLLFPELLPAALGPGPDGNSMTIFLHLLTPPWGGINWLGLGLLI